MNRQLIIFSTLLIIACYPAAYNVYAEGKINNDTYIIYKNYFENKSTGIYFKNNFAFFIAKIKIDTGKVKKTYYETKAILLVYDLLKQYIRGKVLLSKKDNNKYKCRLKSTLNKLFINGNYLNIDISNIEGKVLENWPKNSIYHYVYAVPIEELEKKEKQLNKNSHDVESYIYKIFKQARKEGRYHELITLSLELGLIEDALYYKKKILKNKYNLVNYYYTKNPFLERKKLRKILTYVSNNKKNIDTDIINTLPGDFEIISYIINSKYKNDHLSSIIFYFTLLPDTPEEKYQPTFRHIIESIRSLQKNYQSFKEYSLLLQTLKDDIDKSFFKQNNVLAYSFRTLGHLEFDQTLSGKSNKYFKEADILFQKGINKEKIKQLLLKSINISPRHSDSWNYLGAVLIVDNFIKEALILHTQAYQIDNNNIETMAHIADCYYRLNYKILANNYAKYLKILNRNFKNSFANKIIQKILGEDSLHGKKNTNKVFN